MLYIVEGIDKCGKSTFIRAQGITVFCEGIDEFVTICETLKRHDKVVVHFDSSDKNPVESLKICAAFSKRCDIYMDRCWMSEMTYGAVYRGEINLEPKDEQYIIGLVQNTPHILYYFSKRIAVLDAFDPYECDEKLKCVKTRYDNLISRYKKLLNVYSVEVL